MSRQNALSVLFNHASATAGKRESGSMTAAKVRLVGGLRAASKQFGAKGAKGERSLTSIVNSALSNLKTTPFVQHAHQRSFAALQYVVTAWLENLTRANPDLSERGLAEIVRLHHDIIFPPPPRRNNNWGSGIRMFQFGYGCATDALETRATFVFGKNLMKLRPKGNISGWMVLSGREEIGTVSDIVKGTASAKDRWMRYVVLPEVQTRRNMPTTQGPKKYRFNLATVVHSQPVRCAFNGRIELFDVRYDQARQKYVPQMLRIPLEQADLALERQFARNNRRRTPL
jgi:hypothetical protein